MESQAWTVDRLRAEYGRLPAVPGVYVFRDAEDRPLYVGKSVDLRSRLSNYARARRSDRRKEARIVRAACSLSYEPTGSEFAALLRELDLIQHHRPPLNRRMRLPERYVFVRVDYDSEFPSVAVSRDCDEEGGQYLGPFVQRRRVEAVVSELNDAFGLRTCEPIPSEICWRGQMRRCVAPCLGSESAGAYGRRVLFVREALSGRRRAVIERLVRKRDEHSEAERFEAAGRAQGRIAAIERLGKVLYASALRDGDAIVVQPGVLDGEVDAWPVLGGAIGARRIVRVGDVASAFADLRSAMRPSGRLRPVDKLEVDRRCIVHSWLRRNGGAVGTVLTDGRDERELERGFEAAVRDAVRAQGLFAGLPEASDG